jgi:hypothetical protein
MKRTVPVFLFAVLVAVFGFQVRSADAWNTYSTNGTTGNCATCHGDFRSSPYTSLADGQSWGDDLHDVHRNTMLDGDCDVCHSAGGRFPVILNSSVGGSGLSAISCVGCHGRNEDVTPNDGAFGGAVSGRGDGLRAHHAAAGVNSCAGCHTADTVPVVENVLPPYYATPGTGHPNMPTDPCNLDGNEDFAGSAEGLDNDGDNIYDGADPDCQAAAPQIDVAPASKAYGDVTVGGSSIQEFTISNAGTAALDVSNIALATGTNYSVAEGGSNACPNLTPTINAGNNCTIQITFSPVSVENNIADTLAITSNDTGNSPLNVPLTGNGVAGSAPNISVSPASIPFSDVVVGDSSSPQVVTLSNTGTADLSISGISLTDTTNFILDLIGGSNGCGTATPSIAAGANCTVSVTFAPQSVASFVGSLTVGSDDPDTPTATVSLSGNGTSALAPNISVPASVDLGEVVENDTSAPSEVIISNTGNQVLNVSSIAIDAGTDFTLNLGGGSNPCTTANPIIPAGDSCTVGVVFAPKSVGAISDNLAITSDDPDQPNVNVLLSGTGLDNVKPAVTAATGTGTITVDTSGNPGTSVSGIQALVDTDPSLNQTDKPTGVTFPHGLVSFTVNNVAPGGTITVEITFPAPIPAGSKYYKVNAGGFFEFAGAVISGSTVTLTLTDGGSGDLDAIPGTITDPGGLAVPVPVASSGGGGGCSVTGSGINGGGGAVLFLTLLAILVTLRRQREKARR